MRQSEGRPSLQQPPRFGAYGPWLAVAQLDGGVRVYHVPSSTKNVPGKSRHHAAPASGSLLGAGVFGKGFGAILADGDRLTFKGFPSKALTTTNTCQRPVIEHFRAPPKMARWLPTFFVHSTRPLDGNSVEEVSVMALDLDGNLGCWSRRDTRQGNVSNATPLAFRLLGQNVIGVVQFGEQLLYACAREEHIDIYGWDATSGVRRMSLQRTGTQVFFGNSPSWSGSNDKGLLALQCNATEWLVGQGAQWETITIADKVTVLGVAVSRRHGVTGLVVLRNADRMTIELRSRTERRVLVQSPEPIAQASMNPVTGDIAWIGAQTCRVTVQGIDQDLPFLQISMDEKKNE